MNIMNTQQPFTEEQIERRARSVATNAVREMRVAYGRDPGPWTDDDVRRMHAIFELLHLVRAEGIDMTTESYPLVSPQQAPENIYLDNIEKQLEKLPIGYDPAPEPQEEPETPRPQKVPGHRGK